MKIVHLFKNQKYFGREGEERCRSRQVKLLYLGLLIFWKTGARDDRTYLALDSDTPGWIPVYFVTLGKPLISLVLGPLYSLHILGITVALWKNGLPEWLRWWRICLQSGRLEFDSWIGKIPWRREWQPTLVSLSEEFHGQRSLVGYSPWHHRVGHNWAMITFTLWKNKNVYQVSSSVPGMNGGSIDANQ